MTELLYLIGWNQLVAVLLGVAVWLLCRTKMLRQRPALSHGLWLLVLLKLVTPSLIPVPLLPTIAAQPPSEPAALSDQVVAADPQTDHFASIDHHVPATAPAAARPDFNYSSDALAGAEPLPPGADPAPAGFHVAWRAILPALLGVSLCVSLALWLAAIRQLRQVRRLLRGSSIQSGRAAELLEEVRRRFDLPSAANLVIVDAPITPMLWAAPGNSAIVLPRGLADSLTDDRLRFIIAHELGHFVRRDHWANSLAFLVTTLFWWNPIAWLARRELATAAEACCDSLALERLSGSRKSYAETLLAVVDFVATTKPLRPAIGIAFGESHSLRRRFEMLAAANVKSQISRKGWALLAVAGLASIAFPIAAEDNPAPTGSEAKAAADAKPDEKPAEAPDAAPAGQPLRLPTDVKENEIAGVVVDSQGQPLAGVLVDAWTWVPGSETTTDEHGAFRLKAVDDDEDRHNVEVRFSKPGYSPHYIVQQPVGASSFVVTLGNKTYIEGTVRGPDGKPVAKAEIKGLQGPKHGDGVVITDVATLTTTDAAGRYRLYVFPDTYEMRVVVPGLGVARIPDVAVGEDEAKSLDIDLKPGVRFQARVVDATTHQPVEKVVLWNWRDRSVLGISDSDGKIAIDGMLRGKYEFNVGQGEPEEFHGMTVYFHGILGRWWSPNAVQEWERKTVAPDGWQRNFDGLSFDLSVGMQPVTVEVERGVTFSGHVYDPDGKPVAGATVAPAKTGSGNSLTGDTRYSVKTEKDGSYRVVMPAGNRFEYNLIAHDGDYSEWRNWANAVSEPLKTSPNQQFKDFDFTLNRPATVRGRVVAADGGFVGDHKVRAAAADLRENRYYDPTVKVEKDGSFELKFIRPGKHYIQVSPFWLVPSEAGAGGPKGTSVLVDLKAGDVLDGIELRLPTQAAGNEKADDVLDGVELSLPAEDAPPADDGEEKAEPADAADGPGAAKPAKEPAKAAAAPAGKQPAAPTENAKYYVTGRVFEKETGEPVAGAMIRILVDSEHEPDKRLLLGTSDKTGRYRVEVPLGTVQLWFPQFQPGYWQPAADRHAALTTSPERPIATHDIALMTGTAWPVRLVVEGGIPDKAAIDISVTEVVDDATRLARLRGQYVSFQKPNNDCSSTLAADGTGRFTQCGDSGKLVLDLGGDGIEYILTELLVDPLFDITKVKSIAPVAGTDKVAIIDQGGAKATIGKAEVVMHGGLPLLTFHTARRSTSPAAFQKFAGRVIDAAGNPVEGVRIGLVEGASGGGSGDTGKSVTTDKDGRFTLKERIIEASDLGFFELVITKDGFAGFDSPQIRFPKKAGQAIDLGQFDLYPGQSMPVRVVDGNDQPLAGAVVEPVGRYALRRQAIRTDAQGRGLLRNLPVGVVRARASHGDKFEQTEWRISPQADQNVEATIRLDAAVPGTVARAQQPAPLAVGQVAPEWSLASWSDGKHRKLSDYRGKIVLLQFWATSCAGCVTEIPAMQRLAETYQKQGVVFLAIHSADGEMNQIKKLQETKGWTMPCAIDLRAGTTQGETIDRYRVPGFSTVMLIAPDGKIAYNDAAQDGPTTMARLEKLAESLDIPWPPEKSGEGEAVAKQTNQLVFALYSSEIDKALAWVLPINDSGLSIEQ